MLLPHIMAAFALAVCRQVFQVDMKPGQPFQAAGEGGVEDGQVLGEPLGKAVFFVLRHFGGRDGAVAPRIARPRTFVGIQRQADA